MLPLIARLQHRTHRHLRLEAELVRGGQERVAAEEADVLELGLCGGGEGREQDVVEADVVVDAVAGGLMGADEAVVDEELVVGVSAVRGEDLFAGVCMRSICVCSFVES